jgi:hypothetical protein|tara:strand:- start:265 stop:1473 length:1209 start_codon:yes stop_codon:yes gene_type:complete
MVNTILTPTQVTRAALVILHQKCNFIGRINRQYDSSFAKEGAKIGTDLKIRLPNQYTVRTGAALSTQTTAETSTTLTVSTQKGVDTSFTSVDLTMSLQDFSDRILEPAMSVLAANIENDALSMINDVSQTVDNQTNGSMSMATVLQAKKKLNDALAPQDTTRTGLLTTQDEVDLVNALKGLFQDSTAIKQQYREGMMGRTGGFDFYENTLLSNITSGSMVAASSAAISDTVTATTATSSLGYNNLTLGAGTLVVGDVFTIATLNRVHPESKDDTGEAMQFVVTEAVAGSSINSVSFSPAITMSGARQNVISTAISGKLIVKLGVASTSIRQSLFFHRDAFAFATADLIMPNDVHFKSRQVLDGISMRIIQQYTISDDAIPGRIDVLYGYKTIREQLAAKVWT